MSVAIILPTHNEEAGVGKVIDALRKISKEWEIYVVDSCSTDRTIQIANEKGAKVIELPIRGKGIAVKKAFQEINADYLVMIDSDMTYPPSYIPQILEKLKECDVVTGSRLRGKMEKGAMSLMNRFGNASLSLMATVVYLRPISDICTGMWGFRKSAYKSIEIRAPHLELECDMFAACARKGLKLCEIPIDYKKREGETKLNALKYGFLDAVQLLKRRF
ncbi:MAG: glycosyltransferase family 2 protein [Candidatus Micrarchaeota archaeon]|nr:glycosyltransferase family 2 protein [Candidatus Micrarchaeota archaeon]